MTTPMSKENFKNTFFVVMVDLGNPNKIIETLDYWLNTIKKQVDAYYEHTFKEE